MRICLIAKGAMMKFKKIFPYVIATATLFAPRIAGAHKNVSHNDAQKTSVEIPVFNKLIANDTINWSATKQYDISSKVSKLTQTYINKSIAGQKRIRENRTKHGYTAAVRAELPGAPVNLHCLYGQYTQLQRALKELGDTLTIIPQNNNAHKSCPAFIKEMQKKYDAPEFDGAIHSGYVYKTDAEYESALAKYLTKALSGVKNNIDSARQALIKRFAKTHYSIESLAPGTIMIVPPSRGAQPTHAVVYLGRGFVRDGQFVADTNGNHMYSGYNNEQILGLFEIWDMSNVFSADISKIVAVMYEQELIAQMNKRDITETHQNNSVDSADTVENIASTDVQDIPGFFTRTHQDKLPQSKSNVLANGLYMLALRRKQIKVM